MKKIKEVLMQRVSHIRKHLLPEVKGSSRNKKNRKLFRISQKRKMRAAKVAPTLPYMRVELCMEQAKEVTAVRYYHFDTSGYPICPTCGYAMEKEFQKHCDQCGQLLGWKKFIRDEVTVQRITGNTEQQENVIRSEKLTKRERTPLYTRPPRKHFLSLS